MKKAKVMLSALAVCGVLATTFAFTAQKFAEKVVYTGTSSTTCINKVEGRIITSTPGTLVYASTQSTTSGCTQTYTKAVPNVD